MAKVPYPKGKKAPDFANQDEILLGVLSAVERDAQISQRRMSSDLGVALGLANAYLKRCVRKGWIKIQQVPRRRYAYYLTPQGLAEKTRLAGQYFSASFTFFRRARGQMSDLMSECGARGWNRVAFAGVSDLAEVGVICAHDFPISVIAMIDPARAGGRFCGLPIVGSVADCGEIDAIIVTELTRPEQVHSAICAEFEPDRVLTPALLRIALPGSANPDSLQRAAE
jgi:hypothetical protein